MNVIQAPYFSTPSWIILAFGTVFKVASLVVCSDQPLMPEAQVSHGIEDMVTKGKGMPSTISAETEQFRMEIVPITHSKRKKTMVVDKMYRWKSPTNTAGWVSYAPQHWIERAREAGLEHLMAVVPYAPLICRSRGKLGLMASGHHAMVMCYVLESNVIGMPITTYRSIVAVDYPGSNPDRQRAEEELRVFKVPPEYRVPYSSRKDRTITIMAAFVSENWAWVINDFSALIILHVFSRDEYWTEAELTPGTPVWKKLFGVIKTGGPDWVFESLAAKACLDGWRKKILDEYERRHFQSTLERFLEPSEEIGSAAEVMKSNPNVSYRTLFRPIITEILLNHFNCFAGIGKYSANDLLHILLIHPFTPSYVICQNDDLYSRLKHGIFDYLAQFSHKEYLDRASSIANTSNPFAFNDVLNTEFISKWILVYHRSKATVPVRLYNEIQRQGLLDDNHIIGEPYVFSEKKLLDPNKRQFVYLPVFRCTGIDKWSGYTVIKAKAPEEWGWEVKNAPMLKDIKQMSFKTSIGPSQFAVQVQNRQNYRGIEPGILIVGRPKVEHTGKAGRPRKGLTKKRLKKYWDDNTGRVPIICQVPEVGSDDEQIGSEDEYV